MNKWTDNDRGNLDSIVDAIGEVIRETPEDILVGVAVAACGVFYTPAAVLGHARRGLRALRDELKKWQDPEVPV